MDNCHRRDQEDAVGASVETHIDVCIVQREELSLFGHPWLKLGIERKIKSQLDKTFHISCHDVAKLIFTRGKILNGD